MLHASGAGTPDGSLVGSAVAAEKKQTSSLTVTFKPGKIGITDDGGKVTEVGADSQAQGAGVEIGMVFKTLEGVY